MTYHSGNHLIDPKKLFKSAHVREGMHIADFGCGRTGHIVFSGSKEVGETGIVYAVDILKDVLENIRRRAALEMVHNIETIWANIEKENGISISPNTLDVAFFVNVLFHFNNYEKALNEASRVLKTKSRIIIVDWQKQLSNLGPSNNEKFVDFNKIEEWALNNNFVIQEEYNIGNYHKCIVLFRHD